MSGRRYFGRHGIRSCYERWRALGRVGYEALIAKGVAEARYYDA
jgi:hypothetical protein